MVVDLPRRWAWVIALACLLLIALTLASLLRLDAAPPPAAEPLHPRVAAPVVEAPPSVAAPKAVTVAAVPLTHGADEIEVCGGAWVRMASGPSASPSQIEADPTAFERATELPRRRAEVLETLRGERSELAAAALRVAEMAGTDDADTIGNARDAVVRIALASHDPKVYALAFKVCGGGNLHHGGCALISAAEWARLDPDNATPWLFLLGQEGATRNRPLLDEALHRLATAARADLYTEDAAAALIAAAPAAESTRLAVYDLVTGVMGMEAAVGLPGYQTLTQACRGDALKDANRAQACDGAAEMLTERSAGLLDHMIGVTIGRQLGWPRDRLDRLRGEYEAYIAAEAQAFDEGTQFSCTAIARQFDGLRQKARLGETGVLRAWVAESGKPPAAFIREQRAREAVRAAATLATAASAANTTTVR